MLTYYSARIDSDGSGDGDNLDSGRTTWSGTFSGILYGVRVEYGGTPAATTDTTVSEPNGLQRTILTLTDTNTDTTYNPQVEIQTNAGVATGLYSHYLVDSANLQVVIADAVVDTTDAVVVYVGILEA